MMNQTAQRLGMTQSNFVNPNGLPADEQIVSARDMAILARAADPRVPGIRLSIGTCPASSSASGSMRNYNTLLGRYPGADGMKTGFICASGFNLVATATRDGKRLIAVVLGRLVGAARALKAAQLLERGFSANAAVLADAVARHRRSLQPVDAAPPNLRDEMCGPHRKRPASRGRGRCRAVASLPSNSPYAVFLSSLRAPKAKAAAAAGCPARRAASWSTPDRPESRASNPRQRAEPKPKPGEAGQGPKRRKESRRHGRNRTRAAKYGRHPNCAKTPTGRRRPPRPRRQPSRSQTSDARRRLSKNAAGAKSEPPKQ